MEKIIRDFFYKMKISRFLFYLFILFSVLVIESARSEEEVEIQTWAGFQGLNVLSVGAVANDCKKIFDSCRTDSQKLIDDLTKFVESTQDAAPVPPKLWDTLGRITDILQNAPKNVRFHFAELGDHFLKKLNSAINTAKSINFNKIQDLQSIYNSGVDPTNELVLELEKSFSINYNPNSILQQTLPESLNQASYSQSVALYELKHLSTAVTDEIDSIEKAALQLLNKIYKGITMTKEISFSLKKTGAYPTKYDEQSIKNCLQNCNFLTKALKPGSAVSQPVSTTPSESDSDADPVIPSLCDETPGGDDSGCGEIFRKSEKKIMQYLIITIREIEPINDKKEIDSRIFQVFKNYSLVLSNLNKKIITNVITVVNQFFQLYNIVLSILDKINPDMKSKAEDLLYLQDVDTSDANYENINKYVVEDYLSSSKMNELLDRVDVHIKSMKSLTEIKKGVKQELSVITTELGADLQTFKSTILYVFEELKKGVKALQNLKNKSNRTGFRYYLNFYRGKADLSQLRRLICIINSLKIELLLERQLFTDDEELQAFKDATTDVQNEIDKKNQKLMEELNNMNDFNFVQGFVSRSVLDYNLCIESYTVQSRTILKKVITKYVTIFEELIIIIKRRKIQNAKTIEDLYLDQSSISSNQDETVRKYLLDKTDINVEKLCKTLNQETNIQNKETVTQEISELNTVTHSEVTKINQTVLKLINTMSTEIQNLKTIRDEASQTVDYKISDEKMKCISNIIQIIESLQIKSNKEEIQSLSIYFERVKENIQIASQNFETQTSECVEVQNFKNEVETLKTSIFDSLTKVSLEINEKIRRVLFEYNEKLFILRQNPSCSELNSLQGQDSTFTLNDYTRKYVTGYYTSDEIFTALDTIMSSSSSSDISKMKTEMYAKLDETNQNIESELEKIHDDLNNFVEKFSEGMAVLSEIESSLQKQSDQSITIDATHLSTLQAVDGMVNVIGKYVNVNAESSQQELRVQIDNARLQISKQFEQVSQSVSSTQDYTQMESIMTQTINSCESIYNELKNNTRCELTRSVEEFLNSYQKTITTLHSKVSSSSSQTTILQNLNKGDCKTNNSEFQNFMQLMIEQDNQSLTTVTNTFEFMKKYNFVDSQQMKEKCSLVFQSLSNKMNMEIDKISRVSKYILENVQKANNVLIKLENCENKQAISLSLTDEEVSEFRIARLVNELWKYSSQDTTISSISATIINARSEIDLEYRKIQTKLESSTNQNIQTEIETSLQNIQNIFQSSQIQLNDIVKEDVESFYSSMTKEVNEFLSTGSSTLNTALQSVISNRSVSSSDQQQISSMNVDFKSFTSLINVQQIYNEIKTKTTQNSSQTIEDFKQVINEKFSKVEKTSAYVVENVQKGYSVIEEIKSSLQLDSNYQLTQYQEEQLKKCVTVSHEVGNLKVDAKTAQTTITNSINSIKNQISEEYVKINESVSSLTDDKSIQETVTKGVNKFEQLYAQAKDTVKEQLSLASSGFYSSYMNSINNLDHQNCSQVCKMMRDIENDVSSYQSNSDQSFMDTVSYFNSKSFKSCLSVKNWLHSIQSTTSMETFSSVNEKCTKELSCLNDNISSSFDKMESSSTYVLQSIEKSSELLTSIEDSVKQDATYQLTEEQITELQKCITIYKSIQTITTTSISNTQESIQNSISDVKNKISSACTEITQSISSCADENSIKEITAKGVQKFEQIFSEAKESVKEELFQSFNSFYNSFTQTISDSKSEFGQISSTLQSFKSNANTYQSDDQSYQETVSYFNSEIFKSCITVKTWFNEISTSSSSTSSSIQEKTINEFNGVNEKINMSLDKLETSSSFILQSIESNTQIFKQIETSMIQGTTYELSQEQIIQVQKCMSIYQSVQNTVTSTSTFITQQKIQADITNVKEELTTAYSQITQSISSCSDDHSVRQVETQAVDNYEQIFSHATETIKEQLTQKSSDFYSMFTQLSTDMQQENLQKSVVTSENISQSETDESFTSMTSCFTSIFKSTSVIKNWYSEIKKTTSESDWSFLSGGVSGKVSSDFSTLNDKVTKSIDSMQENSTYVLNSIKKGFDTIKQVKECMMQDSNYKLTQEQVVSLQKCVTIHQTIQKVMITTSITATTEAKQTMESDISNMKSLISEEFNKASETIRSLTDETSINEAATKSVDNMDKFFSETKGKIQSVLSDSSSTFYGTYKKVSSMFEKEENNEMKQVLSDIVNNKNSYQYHNDQSFSNIISYFSDSTYKSTSAIHNWYNKITSSSSTTQSSSFNENAISKLSSLNEQVTKSITSMEENSSSMIDTIEKGSEVLKQIEESTTKNSNYQLSQDQVTYLQKCITIYQTIESISTTTSSTAVSTAKQNISSDISNVKSKMTDEYAKVSEFLNSLTDESSIKQAVDEHVSIVDQRYSETKQKVQTELNQATSDFYNNYQKITSCLNKEDVSTLQDITSSKSTYQATSDETYSKMVSYLNSDTFKSNCSMQNWFKEIRSSSSTNQSNTSECAITELGTLNDRVIKSIDSMEECSNYVLDTVDKGSAIIKQIQQSTKENADYHLSQVQITELQKTFTIYETIKSITTTTSTTTVSTAKQTISSDISNVKSKISDEYVKVSESLKSLTDESSIKQAVDEHVSKVDHCYSETKQKVQTELNQATAEFFSNYQQISSCLNKEDVSTLQDITSSKSTYQATSDETYSKMVSYLNSDTFKSNCSMQNWFKEIHSSSSTNQSSTSECAIAELGTLNDHVTKSIDSMEECSNYVLDTINKGSEVVKRIQQSTKENTDYHLSQNQITELQKTISIHQIIQSITVTNNSTTITSAEQTITSEVSNVKNQINEESTKVAELIRSLSDESSIKNSVDDHVSKVEQYYGQVKDKVQTQLTDTSSNFFSNLQTYSSTLNTENKSETNTVIQDIVNGKNAYQVDNDQSFKNVVTYFNSDSFKSSKMVQNIYQSIQSDASTSASTNYNEQTINNLTTFSHNVSKSVDSMEGNSKYVLDTMNKGCEVIQQIKECLKKDSNYKISQDQITILQKCITIYQIIQTITTTTTTTTSTTNDVAKDEKNSNNNQNANQTTDSSQNSVVSNVGRSIADAFGLGGENKVEKTLDSNDKESTVVNDKTADSTNQTSQHSSADISKVNEETDVETCDSTSISNTQEKITSNVTNAKSQIDSEFTKTSQSISSMSDENSIKKTVNENVQKVDKYYGEAKKEVQTQLTQTTSSFYKSCQKLSENTNSQSNSVLKEIVNDKSTYQADDDENFKQVLTYLNSDSFKSSAEIQDWYKEIHSDTCTSDLSKQSVNELTNLNSRVTKSVDTMENHSKYILDTLKQGSEILKQVEDSSKQHINYELTQNQIIILKKCITIYQVIETITTTTVTKTISVKNSSVSDHSVASDNEYEYEIEAKKNIKEVVQTEETTQEEKVAVDKKDGSNSNLSDISKAQVNDEKKTLDDSSATSVSNIGHKNDDKSKNISTLSSNFASNDSEKVKSLDTHVVNVDASTTASANSSSDSVSHNSIKDEVNKETKSQDAEVVYADANTSQKMDENISSSQNVHSTVTDGKSDTNSATNENAVSKANEKKASKVDQLKKFTKEENTYSKTSLTTLMVNWTITKSTTAGVPNTCLSLAWDKYFKPDDDESTIKEIADLLAVGRSVIEDSIQLKKEKLPLYRDVDDIEMMIVQSTDIVNEILLQLSDVVGQDVQTLKESFSESVNKNLGANASTILNDKTSTLDEDLLSAASTFFAMKGSNKTDLLNQINRQFKNVHIEDEKQAKEIATKQFDKLQSIMDTVLDNIDCLVLRVVDAIEKAKHSISCAKNDENCSNYLKNGQVLCDTVKIPGS